MKREYVNPETEVFTPESEELMQGGGGFITTSDDDINYGKENQMDFEESSELPHRSINLWDE